MCYSSDYYISPGIKCKFDILKKEINNIDPLQNSLDIGCSGNSFLFFLDKVIHKCFLDIAENPLNQYIDKINNI